MTVCLVTGGAGFLGSHLVEALVAAHHAVRVVDNFTTGRLVHLAGVMDAVELFPGDCSNPAFLYKAMRGAELVFHLAWATGLDNHRAPPSSQRRGDPGGILSVLSTAVEARVRRLLFASSMHVYGPAARPVEEAVRADPVTPYGWAKRSGELACSVCTKSSALETVCLRYFNLFGPRQPANSRYAAVLSEALRAVASGRSAELPGEPDSVQDLTYVGDAVHATLLAATASRVAGKVYNVARGQPTTTREVVGALEDLLGAKIEAVYAGPVARGASSNVASVRRAEIDLGFCTAADLRQGLSRSLLARADLRHRLNGAASATRPCPA